MDKLMAYGLSQEDFEVLLDNNVDFDQLAFMDEEDVKLYINQLKNPSKNNNEVEWKQSSLIDEEDV
jgi:hypothetical protein